VNLFVVREEGLWRLASFSDLLQLDLASQPALTSLAAFRRERAERVALTARLRRGHARLVRGLATLPSAPSQRPLACGTGPRATKSGHAEPSARGWSGVHRLEDRLRPVRGPRAARIDLVGARLSSGRGRMCWTFRTRGPVAERVDLDVVLGQETNGDDGRSAVWTLRLEDGRAVGLVERPYGLLTAIPVRASVRGHVARVVVPADSVRDAVRVNRAFGWSVISRAPDPDRAPGSRAEWVDMLPALETLDAIAGIRHRPRR
jgi:hypothetical protein